MAEAHSLSNDSTLAYLLRRNKNQASDELQKAVDLLQGELDDATAYAESLECLVVDVGTISSLPTTKTVAGITSDMVCIHSEIGTPAAVASKWYANTDTPGKVTISGTISGSTTLKLYFVKSR